MVTRIQIAKPDILKEFSQGASVLRLRDVAEVFNQKREFWRLAKSMSLTAFVRFMTEKTDLRSVSYRFPRDIAGPVRSRADRPRAIGRFACLAGRGHFAGDAGRSA